MPKQRLKEIQIKGRRKKRKGTQVAKIYITAP
jgi:hypothetical protein